MSTTIQNKKDKKLSRLLKSNIAKAWYELDPKSYQKWLSGRRVTKSELTS